MFYLFYPILVQHYGKIKKIDYKEIRSIWIKIRNNINLKVFKCFIHIYFLISATQLLLNLFIYFDVIVYMFELFF